MSKAFTREDDLSPEPISLARASLPPGVPNRMTVAGAHKLREQLDRLTRQRERLLETEGETAGTGRIDVRLATLVQSLNSAVIATQPERDPEEVQFGSTVRVVDAKGLESTYHLVGVDEADFENDEISWLSPVARALMGSRAGDSVVVDLPAGARTLRVREVTWRSPA